MLGGVTSRILKPDRSPPNQKPAMSTSEPGVDSKIAQQHCYAYIEDSDLRMSGAAMPPLRVIARPSSDDVIAFAVRKSAGSPRRHDVAPPDLTPRGDGGDVPGVESSDLSGLIV